MAATYGVVNLVSSLGFCSRWRTQCVGLAAIRPGMVVYDLMCGMGECWPRIAKSLGGAGRIVGVDYSAEMCRRGRRNAARFGAPSIEVREQDALASDLLDESADAVVACFAVKTLSAAQHVVFAREVWRLLRRGGTFALLEISVPPSILRVPYMFYVSRFIPLIGRLFLGNPDNYRMLGVYTTAFGDCERLVQPLRAAGLSATQKSFFFGCATAVYGAKN